jgi:hypothetical protein
LQAPNFITIATMPPKKTPSEDALEQELRDAVRRIYQQDKSTLTVNAARQAVVTKLKLKDDFFRGDDWKARSKQIVHGALVSPLGGSVSVRRHQ